MPAGNDANTAAAELADKFGAGAGNAEKMIKASRERYTGDLGKAQLMEAEDVEVDLEVLASAVGEKSILAATVRGPYVVYTAEAKDGRTHKGAIELAELEDKKPKAKPKKAEPKAETKAESK